MQARAGYRIEVVELAGLLISMIQLMHVGLSNSSTPFQ